MAKQIDRNRCRIEQAGVLDRTKVRDPAQPRAGFGSAFYIPLFMSFFSHEVRFDSLTVNYSSVFPSHLIITILLICTCVSRQYRSTGTRQCGLRNLSICGLLLSSLFHFSWPRGRSGERRAEERWASRRVARAPQPCARPRRLDGKPPAVVGFDRRTRALRVTFGFFPWARRHAHRRAFSRSGVARSLRIPLR
jgi:hypothetical protein